MPQEDTENRLIEEKLNLLLLNAANLQDNIWERLQSMDEQGRLKPDLEEHVKRVMREVSSWMDECTAASESPPILLRRMEIQLIRLEKVDELIKKIDQ